jgi:hypothetical protein
MEDTSNLQLAATDTSDPFTITGAPVPDARNKPYVIPINWKDWEKRHNVARPYDTPWDEWIENEFEPRTAKELIKRWEGTVEENEIISWWGTLSAKVERTRRQMQRRREQKMLDHFTSNEYKDWVNVDNVEILLAKIKWIESVFEAGKWKRPEREGDPQTGYRWVENERILGIDDFNQLITLQIRLSKQIDALQKSQEPTGDESENIRGALIQKIENKTVNYTVNHITWAEMKKAKETALRGELSEASAVEASAVEGEVIEGSQ